MTTIFFDMDGTIADLYEVPNWLEQILSSNVNPYYDALPIEKVLHQLYSIRETANYKIGIITWGCKGGSTAFLQEVSIAKKCWLSRRGIRDIEFHCLPYGTPKNLMGNEGDILVDDDDNVRLLWEKTIGKAFHPNEFEMSCL